jgi:hypothetical protein
MLAALVERNSTEQLGLLQADFRGSAMKIQDRSTVWDVVKLTNVEAALSKLHGSGRNAFWLSRGRSGFPAKRRQRVDLA